MTLYGVTGGVGMGKSAAEECLRRLGASVVDTDRIARDLVAPGEPALREIAVAFGDDLLDASGALRREELGRRVFADPAARRKLEAILHPRIRAAWRGQVDRWRMEGRTTAAVIIPLLFETGAQGLFDVILCLACTPETQRRRLAERGWSDEQIRQRVAAQLPIEEKMARADVVLWNEADIPVLEAQLQRVLRRH